ncbi:hypothetical protein X734_33070 [Mesorhizobium sp. L2C084A000]|nr:hypothetical protein X734_33070 [Mesorhizobium sp. L2C084A000]
MAEQVTDRLRPTTEPVPRSCAPSPPAASVGRRDAGPYFAATRIRAASAHATPCNRGRRDGIPIADWEVCLQVAHPGYIGWEESMENQRRLANNINRYAAGHSGVPRKGAAGHRCLWAVRAPDEPAL